MSAIGNLDLSRQYKRYRNKKRSNDNIKTMAREHNARKPIVKRNTRPLKLKIKHICIE